MLLHFSLVAQDLHCRCPHVKTMKSIEFKPIHIEGKYPDLNPSTLIAKSAIFSQTTQNLKNIATRQYIQRLAPSDLRLERLGRFWVTRASANPAGFSLLTVYLVCQSESVACCLCSKLMVLLMKSCFSNESASRILILLYLSANSHQRLLVTALLGLSRSLHHACTTKQTSKVDRYNRISQYTEGF